MKIFEFHFNNKKDGFLADTFCYEPENIYEKRLGFLFLAGEIKNLLPQNIKFLDNLAELLKERYFKAPYHSSIEAVFKESLKEANKRLDKIVKEGNVSWLGNLSLAIFSLTNQKNRWHLNFAKTGKIKILLIRKEQIMDIGKNLELQDFEPYPLKMFSNIVSGKLIENDIILVLTEQVFSYFAKREARFSKTKQNNKKRGIIYSPSIIEKIAKIQIDGKEDKKIKEILKEKEKEFSRLSGICLLCILTKTEEKEQKNTLLSFKKEPEKVSFSKIFSSFVKPIAKSKKIKNKITKPLFFFKKIKTIASRALKLRLKDKTKKAPRKKKAAGKRIRIKVKRESFFKKTETKLLEVFKKNLVLFIIFLIILLIGFFLFNREEREKTKAYQNTISTVREEIAAANNYLNSNKEKEAFSLFEQAYEKITPLSQGKNRFQKEALSLKSLLEEKLGQISKSEKIENPELFFSFEKDKIPPSRVIYFKQGLYSYTPLSQIVYKIKPDKTKKEIGTSEKFDKAAAGSNGILFFKKPDYIFLLKDDNFQTGININPPYSEFQPKALALYGSSLYFLDNEGRIIKYPALSPKSNPLFWLNKNEVAKETVSFAIDGNIWLLEKNKIKKYFKGEKKQEIEINVFPKLKNPSKIFTSQNHKYLYILDPLGKRIIILEKNGRIIRQAQSEKFNNLLDFAVSQDEKEIYLLNGPQVFKIKI